MNKNKIESKMDYLKRHYELVANDKQFAKPYKTPKKLPPNTDSFYKKAEDFNAAASKDEKKIKSLLSR